MFSEAVHKDNQLMRGDPRSSTYLACALLARGDVAISDMHRNVQRLKKGPDNSLLWLRVRVQALVRVWMRVHMCVFV